METDIPHWQLHGMRLSPNFRTACCIDRRLDYTCESKTKTKALCPGLCFVYLVPPTPLLFKRKVMGGKEVGEMSTAFWDPPSSIWDNKAPHSSSPIHVFSGPDTALFRFFAMLFQDNSSQIKLSSKETTKPKPFATSQGDAAQFPKNYTLLVPITGLPVKPWALVWNA